MVHHDSLIHGWTHGTKSLVLLYAIFAAASFAGLKQGRATARAYVLWPFTTLITLFVVGLASEFIVSALSKLIGETSVAKNLASLAVYIAGGFLGGLFWARRGRPLAAIERRGAMLFDGQAAQRETRKLRAKAGAQSMLTVAGVAVPFEDETKHFKLLGATGTGKSTAIRELLHGALNRGDRAVIADPDGGYLSRFYDPARGDVILNPFDVRSAKWDLFAELRNTYDVDELAQAFIPDRGSDPTWTTFARTLFSAITSQAQIAGIRDVAELYRLLVAAPKQELVALAAGTPAAPFLEEGSEKLFQGARSTVTAAVKSLDFVRRQPGSLVSVREWIKSGRGVLFL
ncbi:MAG: type IV secretion system DNA-binding domain-containing protein, partial [Steroidobacteraceae bacterium]